jgi:hypothetical protein
VELISVDEKLVLSGTVVDEDFELKVELTTVDEKLVLSGTVVDVDD